MTPTQIGLKIMFEGAHFLIISMFAQDARELMEKWMSATPGKERGSCQSTGLPWVVDLAKIVGMHGVDVEVVRLAKQMQDAQVAQGKAQIQGGYVGPQTFWPGGSGKN